MLNNDVLKEVISFCDKNQYQLLSEIDKFFHHFMSVIVKKKPSKKYLLSSIQMYNWVVDHGFSQRNIYRTIIRYSNNPIDLLNHVYSKKTQKLLTTSVFIEGLKTKNMNVSKWLKDHYCRYSTNLFNDYDLDLEDIEWIKKELIWYPTQLYELMKSKKVDYVKWACINQSVLRSYLFEFAVNLEQIEMINWGISQGYQLENEVFAIATKKGNFEICELLKKNNCKVDGEALYYAVQSNNFEMVKWCIKNNFPSNSYACAEAANNNNLEILQYLRKHNVEWDVNTFIEAKRHPQIFYYVVKNGCPQK